MKRHSSRLAGAAIVLGVLLAPTAAHAKPGALDQEIRSVDIPGFRLLSLSPDGQLLAAYTPESLCVFDAESLAERACADLEAGNVAMSDRDVVWSPDSTRIALTENALVFGRDGDLWVMDVSNGELVNLTDDGYEGGLFGDELASADDPVHVDVAPAWSPDGASVTISRTTAVDGESTGNEIVDVEVASGEVESLTTVSTNAPYVVYQGMEWAPDGQRLYYSVGHPEPDDPDNGIWEFDRSTGESRQIVGGDAEKGPPSLAEVDATGDTGLVTYPLLLGSSGSTLVDWVMLADLTSGEVMPIDPTSAPTDDSVSIRLATFSSDGTEVLFATYDGEVGRLWLRGLPDGKAAEVAASADWLPTMGTPGSGLDWGSDGTVFASDGLDDGIVLHIGPTAD